MLQELSAIFGETIRKQAQPTHIPNKEYRTHQRLSAGAKSLRAGILKDGESEEIQQFLKRPEDHVHEISVQLHQRTPNRDQILQFLHECPLIDWTRIAHSRSQIIQRNLHSTPIPPTGGPSQHKT